MPFSLISEGYPGGHLSTPRHRRRVHTDVARCTRPYSFWRMDRDKGACGFSALCLRAAVTCCVRLKAVATGRVHVVTAIHLLYIVGVGLCMAIVHHDDYLRAQEHRTTMSSTNMQASVCTCSSCQQWPSGIGRRLIVRIVQLGTHRSVALRQPTADACLRLLHLWQPAWRFLYHHR
jgi:hypothetical protein